VTMSRRPGPHDATAGSLPSWPPSESQSVLEGPHLSPLHHLWYTLPSRPRTNTSNVLDPVRFRETLQVTVQALGWWGDRTFQPLTEEIDSVAYWYQALPTAPFPQFPGPEGRWPRIKRDWGGGPPSRPYTGGQPRQGRLCDKGRPVASV
jgi:hypothetical protein